MWQSLYIERVFMTMRNSTLVFEIAHLLGRVQDRARCSHNAFRVCMAASKMSFRYLRRVFLLISSCSLLVSADPALRCRLLSFNPSRPVLLSA